MSGSKPCPVSLSELICHTAGVDHVQIFPGEQYCLIHHVVPRSLSKALVFISMGKWHLSEFYELALSEEAPCQQSNRNWLLVQPSSHRCQPRARGPKRVVYGGTWLTVPLRQPFCVFPAHLGSLCYSFSPHCSHVPIALRGCLLLTLHCIFSSAPTVLSWKLGGHRPRVSGVIECAGVVCVFAHTFILTPFQCDIC